jgi:hypothetical protein
VGVRDEALALSVLWTWRTSRVTLLIVALTTIPLPATPPIADKSVFGSWVPMNEPAHAAERCAPAGACGGRCAKGSSGGVATPRSARQPTVSSRMRRQWRLQLPPPGQDGWTIVPSCFHLAQRGYSVPTAACRGLRCRGQSTTTMPPLLRTARSSTPMMGLRRETEPR